MKKVAYIAGGILIGFVLSTSAGAFADSVKSLVGKKVSGEYTVIVDGQKLADKGAIIDGKANVPVRGISEALGADIKVSGKTITVTTASTEGTDQASAGTVNSGTDYDGKSREYLIEQQTFYSKTLLEPNKAGRAEIVAEIEQAKKSGNTEYASKKEAQLKEYDDRIATYEYELAKIEAALAALK
ncbi:stalk domain-containing protein [Paenibacillus xylanilyticus]|uniref:stalk domain-containing protein n=1 Tax=Paenibacillus xylanilyticus TaxID=248903 RepID=UPI003AAA22AB